MLQEARSLEIILERSFSCVNVLFLVQFLELRHLENVLQVCLTSWWSLVVYWLSKNVSILSGMEFQVFCSIPIGNLSKPCHLRGEGLI